MARPKSTAATPNTAPDAQASGKSVAIVAYGEEKRPSQESRRESSDFASVFENLPGVMPEQKTEPDKPEKKDSEKPKAREAEAVAEEPELKPEKEEKPKAEKSKAVLSDEEDDEEDDSEEEEDSEGKEAKGSVADQLYKARQKKRELKAAVATEKARADALEAKLSSAAIPEASGELFYGTYAQVKTPADLDNAKAYLERIDEYLDDRPEGFEDEKTGTEWDAKMVKQKRREIKDELKRADQISKFFTNRDKSTAKAKDLYPEVFNASYKRHDAVLDLAKEYPEIARSPHSALLLGRLAVAMLIESGEYIPVKKGAAKKAEPEAKAQEVEKRQATSEKPAAIKESQDLKSRALRGDKGAVTSIFERLAGVDS